MVIGETVGMAAMLDTLLSRSSEAFARGCGTLVIQPAYSNDAILPITSAALSPKDPLAILQSLAEVRRLNCIKINLIV